MGPSTFVPISTVRDSSADTSMVKTHTPPSGAGIGGVSAFLISVETTNARVTFDGTDPSAGSAPSHVWPKDQIPQLVLLGPGSVVKWCSTLGAASVVQITWLTN